MKLSRSLAAATASLMLVAACSSSSSHPKAGSAQTLTWWSMWNKGEPQQVALQQVANDFMAAYPNIKVNITWGGRDILTKVRSSLLSKNPPDLVDKDADEMGAAIINTGQALPLDDVLNTTIYGETGTVGQAIPKAYLDQFNVSGHQYLIPSEVITAGFWYNQKLFDQAGVSAPTTWDGFLSLIQTLKSKGIVPLASDNENFFNIYYFTYLAERILGNGVLDKIAGDKSGAGWDNPGVLKAAQAVQQLVAAKPFESQYDGSKWPAAEDDWARGKSAMLMLGSWAPSETSKFASPGFAYRMFNFPTVSNATNGVEAYLVGYSIPKSAKNPDAAKKFIAFALSKKELQGTVTTAQTMVPRTDVAPPPALADAAALLKSGAPLTRLNDGLLYDYPGWWATVLLPLDDDLFYGKITADQFVAKLKQQSISYWKTHTS
jgi:raffinose/stachyose/melibiose transport system substrate-binding protein